MSLINADPISLTPPPSSPSSWATGPPDTQSDTPGHLRCVHRNYPSEKVGDESRPTANSKPAPADRDFALARVFPPLSRPDIATTERRSYSFDCQSKNDEGKLRFVPFIVKSIGEQSKRGVVPNQKGGSCVSFSRRQN